MDLMDGVAPETRETIELVWMFAWLRHAPRIRQAIKKAMQVIPLDQFPRSITGYGRFQTVQILWDEQPRMRPRLARGLRRMCRSINHVITGRRISTRDEQH